MKKYVQSTVEVIEFTEEEVVMNLVASSDTGSDLQPPATPNPQPGVQDGQDSEFIS